MESLHSQRADLMPNQKLVNLHQMQQVKQDVSRTQFTQKGQLHKK